MMRIVLILHSLQTYCRYTPTVSHIKHVSCELDYCNGSGDSNFLDLDWLSTSENERFVHYIKELQSTPFLTIFLLRLLLTLCLNRSKAISTPDVNISTVNASDVNSGITVSAFYFVPNFGIVVMV